jgi:two-component system, NtrC family, response regulator AtoC
MIGSSTDVLLGESPQMQRVRSLIAHFAKSPAAPALITGELGTGKALVVRAMHAATVRASHPLVVVACANHSTEGLERALFGRESDLLLGAFDQADDGAVFLEDVDRLAPALQSRLLRVIDTHMFNRAEGVADVATGARVVASSSLDLERLARSGGFRDDLFYRLSVLRIDLPPLRTRPDDVPALVAHFAERFGREFNQDIPTLTPDVMVALKAYAWPGNVRELRNLVERAMLDRVASPGAADLTAWLPGHPRAAEIPAFVLPETGISLEAVERSLLLQALERTGGNQTRAAALLGLHRDQVRYRIEKFGLRP